MVLFFFLAKTRKKNLIDFFFFFNFNYIFKIGNQFPSENFLHMSWLFAIKFTISVFARGLATYLLLITGSYFIYSKKKNWKEEKRSKPDFSPFVKCSISEDTQKINLATSSPKRLRISSIMKSLEKLTCKRKRKKKFNE